MALQRRDVWVCDDPLCKEETQSTEDSPKGYSGVVSTEGGTGCRRESWYACKQEHIAPAILWVVKCAQNKAWTNTN